MSLTKSQREAQLARAIEALEFDRNYWLEEAETCALIADPIEEYFGNVYALTPEIRAVVIETIDKKSDELKDKLAALLISDVGREWKPTS